MGKKVNPKIFRISATRVWPSKWFAGKAQYARKVEQDVTVRRYVTKKFIEAGIDRVEIERTANKININIHTAKPGILIGRGGKGVEELKKEIHSKFLSRPAGIKPGDVNLNIFEVSRPNLSAQIVMQSMILDIEKRMPFKRVMKQAVNRAERAGSLGIKVKVGGRLNGSEIARSESIVSGKVPLSTLRADVDYSRGMASTIYGAIGIKVWIYKGELSDKLEVKKGDVVGKKRR